METIELKLSLSKDQFNVIVSCLRALATMMANVMEST